MAQSLAKNIIHLIYSTKNRTPCLGLECREKLYDYQAGIFDEWESPAIVIGGVADHVHTLFVLSKNHRLTRIVEEVKKGSSKWLKTLDRSLASFHWQNGYGAFSVSQSNVAQVWWPFSQGVALGCHVSALRADLTGFVSDLRPVHGISFRPFGPMSGASFRSM